MLSIMQLAGQTICVRKVQIQSKFGSKKGDSSNTAKS
jgi:hypothetical protein